MMRRSHLSCCVGLQRHDAGGHLEHLAHTLSPCNEIALTNEDLKVSNRFSFFLYHLEKAHKQ